MYSLELEPPQTQHDTHDWTLEPFYKVAGTQQRERLPGSLVRNVSNGANNHREIPYCLTTMPNIREIKFDMNRITHFDFYWTASLEYLNSIDLSFNLAMVGNPIDCSWTTREKNKAIQRTNS
uniref:Uncharacterized protein n=1 Tax=Anopheles albimanus TaxID=7167 RepID=A0A182F0Q6_ANOAL